MLDGFTWICDNTTHMANTTIIGFLDIVSGNLTDYDVLMMPGSPSYFTDSFIDQWLTNGLWRKNIRKFVRNGGGYVGTCGSAAIATQDPLPGWPFVHSLSIVNLYSDIDIRNEGQYGLQLGMGIPIKINIEEPGNPIFSGYYGINRSINYFGGPGMYDANLDDPLYGNVTILASYIEEPSDIAPIHRQLRIGDGIVKTSIRDKYAIIATTFGEGRIVLFGPHPEYGTWINVDGNPDENLEEGWSPVKWYRWIGGDYTGFEYNNWMMKKSIAWVTKNIR